MNVYQPCIGYDSNYQHFGGNCLNFWRVKLPLHDSEIYIKMEQPIKQNILNPPVCPSAQMQAKPSMPMFVFLFALALIPLRGVSNPSRWVFPVALKRAAWSAAVLRIPYSWLILIDSEVFTNVLRLGHLRSGHQAKSSGLTSKNVPSGTSEPRFNILIWCSHHILGEPIVWQKMLW